MKRLTIGKRNGKVIWKARKSKSSLQENPWLLKLIDDHNLTADINNNKSKFIISSKTSSLCVACKGGKYLCGKTRCPLVVRFSKYLGLFLFFRILT